MRFPIIVVNFKVYRESAGNRGLELAKIAEKVVEDTSANIAIAPNLLDLIPISKEVKIPVFAQHVDPVPYGAYTGHISPYYLKEIGIPGTIINHSERKLNKEILKKTLSMLSDIGLETIVCVDSIEELNAVISFGVNVTCIAIEPPELIGTGRAVSKYKPELLEKAVEIAREHNLNLLCGAGIVTGEDVRKAIDIGTKGILVASGVVKAKNPENILREFWDAMK